MGKKKIKELRNQIDEARQALEDLEKKKDKKVAKAQHKVVEDLQAMMNDETLKKEGLLELGEEFWQEAKGILAKMKAAIKKKPDSDQGA